MTEEKIYENQNHLDYLQDVPLHDLAAVDNDHKDYFQHGGYIEALFKMVSECPERFCIGLFGGWGSGKTGIVKGLEKKVEKFKDNTDIKLLYFNVWKYSDDSLRRQLLLKIDKDWFEGKLEYDKKMYVDVSQTTEISSGFSWKLFFSLDRMIPLVVFLLFIGFLAYFQGPDGYYGKDWISMIGTAIIPVFIVAITAMQGKDKIVKTIEDGSKPTSPEEFEKLFKKALERKELRGKRKVFILDDLDRCNNKKVLEVLAGISTFLGEEKCIYVIPCDDKRIKMHIGKGLYNENGVDGVSSLEKDDFLKKLFNAHISLRPTGDEHLEEYIEKLLEKIGVNKKEDFDKLQYVLQVGLSKNPRRIKQFLNNLVAGYNLAIELENDGSLTNGVITKHIGFLAKVLFIRDYFPKSYEYFEINPGSFTEMEIWVGENQRNEESLNEMQNNILNEQAEDIILRRFIDATSGITNSYPDIFFRFYGKKNIVEVDTISNIIAAAEGKNMIELQRLLNEVLKDDNILAKLKIEVIGRVKAVKKSAYLRTNLTSSFININNEIDDNKIKKLTGNIIGHTPDDILRSVHREISPIVWDLAASKFIAKDKVVVLANIVFSFISSNYAETTVESGPGWNLDSEHLKKINENWQLFPKKGQNFFTDVVRQIIEVEIKTEKPLNVDFWNWILPEDGEVPKVIRNSGALRQIAKEIKGDKANLKIRKAGLLVTRMHKLSNRHAIGEMIIRMLKLFDAEFVESEKEKFAPEIVLEWVTESEQVFDNAVANNIYDKLKSNHKDWEIKGYNTYEEWLYGYIELYMKVDETRKGEIKDIVVGRIEENSELYDKHYKNSQFNGDLDLNFSALNAFASVSKLDFVENKSEWMNIVTNVLENVFKFKCRRTLNHLIQPLWEQDTEEAFNLGQVVVEILAERRDELDNPKLIAKTALDSLLDSKFWVNLNDGWKEGFIKSYMTILDTEKINQTNKDDICSAWLTAYLKIEDSAFRSKYINLRNELYSRLSTDEQANSLNQIWTRIKRNLEDGIDLQFFEKHFDDAKADDKQELFEELFEQLNSADQAAVKLFIEYGLKPNIINEDVNLWVERVIPIIRRDPSDLQILQIVKNIKEQTELLHKAKQYKELDELINPPPPPENLT